MCLIISLAVLTNSASNPVIVINAFALMLWIAVTGFILAWAAGGQVPRDQTKLDELNHKLYKRLAITLLIGLPIVLMVQWLLTFSDKR
jgi:hypothetical protein